MDVEILGFPISLTWFLVIVAFLLYLAYDTWSLTYWKRMGVVQVPPLPVIGNLLTFSKPMPGVFMELEKEFGTIYGTYNFAGATLNVTDPDLLRLIMVKDFNNFHDRIILPQTNKEFAGSVANLAGERWREVRNLLTPSFSGSKMKQMSSLVNDCADKMIENIGKKQKEHGIIECRELFGAFVMDTIGSCAFGLDIDSQSDVNDPFVSHAKRAFSQFSFTNPFTILGSAFPSLGYVFAFFNLGMFFPLDVMDFFKEVTLKTVALRKNNTKGKRVDFLQSVIDAQYQGKDAVIEKEEDADENDLHNDLDRHHNVQYHSRNLGKNIKLTDDELVGQAVIFFTAGYETTNTLLGFIFYSLSMHPEVQEKLIQEVDDITPNRDAVGYTSVASMPYLDQVVCETLRIYPPAVVVNRMCTKTLEYKGMRIGKGVSVFIPVYNIHHNPKYWPEPHKFDPDRFTKERRANRHPFAWLPFGAGPHNCIGMRFALMETKMAIARVLQKYRFETCPQTEIPPVFGKTGFLSPPNGVTLKVVPRTDCVQ